MRVAKLIFILAISSVWLNGCGNDDGGIGVDNNVNLEREQDKFIWQAMNLFYYWQEDVTDLQDNRFADLDELYSFVNGFSSSEILFEELLFQDDRFSFIVDDYHELDDSFQGISKSFGYEFGLVALSESSDDILGYVEYVLPNSPAESAGLQRGDIFIKVNDTQLTRSNFRELLFGTESIKLSLATLADNTLTETGETIEMVAITLTENPIFLSKIQDVDGVTTGYLVYNQFINNNDFHRELNQTFGEFNANNIEELVLDLRYNPGGSISTTRILSSMIYGGASSSTLLGTIDYNSKLAEFDADLTFFDKLPIFNTDNAISSEETLNRLNLDRVFILTSSGTASASELIIAGLQPFIDVVIIGEQTVGKNEGSVTLYDSPDQSFLSNEPGEINENHTYAIQPIISQLLNSEGLNYNQGLSPLVELNELDFLGDFKPLGDPDEPLLSAAFDIISAGAARVSFPQHFGREQVFNSATMKNKTNTAIIDGTTKKRLLEQMFQQQ